MLLEGCWCICAKRCSTAWLLGDEETLEEQQGRVTIRWSVTSVFVGAELGSLKGRPVEEWAAEATLLSWEEGAGAARDEMAGEGR